MRKELLLTSQLLFVFTSILFAQQTEFLPGFDTASFKYTYQLLGKIKENQLLIKYCREEIPQIILLNDSGIEVGRKEIRVFEIEPGVVLTPIPWQNQMLVIVGARRVNNYYYHSYIKIDEKGNLLDNSFIDSIKIGQGVDISSISYEAISTGEKDKLVLHRELKILETNSLIMDLIQLSGEGKIMNQRRETLYFNDIKQTRYSYYVGHDMIYASFYDKVARRSGKSFLKIFEFSTANLQPNIVTIDLERKLLESPTFFKNADGQPTIVGLNRENENSPFDAVITLSRDNNNKQKWQYSISDFSKELKAKLNRKAKKSARIIAPNDITIRNVYWDKDYKKPFLFIENNSYFYVPSNDVILTYPENNNPDYAISNSPVYFNSNNLSPSAQFDQLRYMDKQNQEAVQQPYQPNRVAQTPATVGHAPGYQTPTASSFNPNPGTVSYQSVLIQDFIHMGVNQQTSELLPGEINSSFTYDQLPLHSFNTANSEESVAILFNPQSRSDFIFLLMPKQGSPVQTRLLYPNKFEPLARHNLVQLEERKLGTLYVDRQTNKIGLLYIKWWPN